MNWLVGFLKGGNRCLWGIDIGTFGIKATLLEECTNHLKLKKFGKVEYKEQVFAGSEVVDRYALINSLNELLNSLELKGGEVAIHVPLSSCFYTVISIVEDKSPEEAVSEYMKTVITPEEIGEVKIKYKVLPFSVESGRVDVAIAAVKKSFLEERIAILEQAGLKVVVVDIEPAAINNQFYVNNPEKTAVPICLVDIGASFTKVVVSFGGYPYVTRNIEFGGNYLSEKLQKEFLISVEEAERLKRGENLESVSYEEAFEKVVSKFIRKMVTEVMWTIDTFKERYNLEVEEVHLYGGVSKLRGIVKEMEKYIAKKVFRGEPLGFAQVSEAQEYDVSVGLSLRYKGDENVKV